MDGFLKKAGPWVPLLIAAGYFVFLIATYVRMVSELRSANLIMVSDKAGEKKDD